jgi:hypothetical protein
MSLKNEIIKMLLEGFRNKEIASKLNCVPGSVVYYKKQLNMLRVKKERVLGKAEQRMVNTGLDRQSLKEATTKFLRKKENAKKTSLPFTLSFDDLSWPTHCPITKAPLKYATERGSGPDNAVSFFLQDKTKGFVKGNVTVMSRKGMKIYSKSLLTKS